MEIEHEEKPSSVFTLGVFAGLFWTIVLFGFYVWGVSNVYEHTEELATSEARAFFQEIVTARYWNAAHGGVYVPVTEKTQPNPYLDDPNRDVVTLNGLQLTKINPAFMTRQIAEIASKKNLVWFHITSEKPIRPANSPDSWESGVLKSFAQGLPEFAEFSDSENGARLFRYMAPLWVDGQCLRCHAKQGYKEGDLRGGISVTIQADDMMRSQHRQIRNLSLTYGIIWILGLLGILLTFRRLIETEKKREQTIFQLQAALARVKKLSGLLPICASCKKIRDDKGYWNQIESFIRDHSEAEFTHGICPECAEAVYARLHERDQKKKDEP